LIGLKHTPRAWHEKIDTYFFSIILYVDDIIIIGNQFISIQNLKENLKNEFEITNLGLLHYFLGVQIWHMADGIFLPQPKYASY